VLPPGEETDARRAHHSFRDNSGDFVSYLKLLSAYHSAPVRKNFCEKNYLDERAMAEISNVVFQLEEIISAMQIPIPQNTNLPNGARLESYLCCIAKGLIQFVCVREGGKCREKTSHAMYRSLTADRILIISAHYNSVVTLCALFGILYRS
jgi:HrpA-like RNA helicase